MRMELKCQNGTTVTLNETEQAQVYGFYRLHQTMKRLEEVLGEKETLRAFKSEDAIKTVARRVLELKDDYHISEDNAIETVFEDTDYIEAYLTKDMGETISARIQQALENDEDELDFYMEMLENGIDIEMVRKFVSDEAAEHMLEFCEEHGLLESVNLVVMNCDDRLVEYEWSSKESFLKAMNSDEGNIPMLDDAVNTLTVGEKYHNENVLNDIGITSVADVVKMLQKN